METFSTGQPDEQNPAHNPAGCQPDPQATSGEQQRGDGPQRDDEPPGAAPAVPAGSEPDPRVREVAELLAAGAEVTGLQVAARHGVSPRTGRRLLAEARTHLERSPSPNPPDLHLVENRTAGGTA